MKNKMKFILMFLFGIGILTAGCRKAEFLEDETQTLGENIHEMMITEVEAFILVQGDVPRLFVKIKGYLNNGGTIYRPDLTKIQRAGNRFNISLFVESLPIMCTQALVPFSLSLPLTHDALVPGTYTVDVNGKTSTVTLKWS